MTDPHLRLRTPLTWFTMSRGLYHFDKLAHSALIGFALWCLLPFRHGLLAALVAGALIYLVVGKLLFGRDNHPPYWQGELLDWIADLIIGSAACALAIWKDFGLEVGLIACGLWLLAYATFCYRYAIP